MLHPANIEEKLGFNKIRDLLNARCITSGGRDKCQGMSFIRDESEHDQKYDLLREMLEVRATGTPKMLDFSGAEDILPLFRVQGKTVGSSELLICLYLIESSDEWVSFLQKNNTLFPRLYSSSTEISIPIQLLTLLKKSIDSEGNIVDSASKELYRLRKKIGEQERATRKSLQRAFKEYTDKGWIPEGSSISVRNGRSVIPLKAENKKRVNGYFQGESSSGNIVYIEPDSIVELSNEIMALRQAELREIQRILAFIAAEAHRELASLMTMMDWISEIDFLLAKAKLARDKGFAIPSRSSTTKLVNCYHPSLFDSNTAEGKPTVPLSIELSMEGRILVISGPNAGGKSVALKTVGIVQLMFQHGLPISGMESSRLRLFDKIILDIGDNQSLENDLSTYSSHLQTMRNAIEVADHQCLFLFDEFGSGTSPRIGGAIGESVLECLNNAGAYGVLTTHYDNIKEFGNSQPGVVNAAMRFDVDHLNPLYEIEFGRPGSSFALEMARKSGIHNQVIKRAEELAGKSVVEMEILLTKIQNQKRSLEKKEAEASVLMDRLNKEKEKYAKLHAELKEKKEEIVLKAREEARRLLSDANREIEKTIRHIKTSKAHKGETQKVRKKFEEKKKQLDVTDQKKAKPVHQPESKDFKVGDRVKIIGHDTSGIIRSVSKNEIEIESGTMTMRIKPSQLQVLEENKEAKAQQSLAKRLGIDMTSRRSSFRHELDLRGKRGEEAILLVDKYLDDATLLGANEVRILHGKGDGILRKLVRERLTKHPQIAKFEDDHPDRGGAGITQVYLK